MVGALMLYHYLECIRNKRKKTKSSKKKLKKDVCDPSKKRCRICLNEGTIPIFGNVYREDLSDEVNLFGGVLVHIEDDYPKHLCESCYHLLQSARLFRRTAQRTERILKQSNFQIETNDHENTNSDDGAATDLEEDSKGKTFNCTKCNIEFDSLKSLTDHQLTDEHENPRRKCGICNKTFTAAYIKFHINTHVKRETPFMCDICGKKFVMKGQFTRHRLTHFFDLPFKCAECPYRGRFIENLRLHMRTHTGEKPYQCAHCPSRFVNKSNLNKHMWTHKPERDFKCETCGKGYHTKKHLDNHFKVDHVGIKEHVCNICGKAFGYRKQMMKHQLGVHKRQKLQSGRLPLYLRADSK